MQKLPNFFAEECVFSLVRFIGDFYCAIRIQLSPGWKIAQNFIVPRDFMNEKDKSDSTTFLI